MSLNDSNLSVCKLPTSTVGTADPLIVWDTFKCAFRGHAFQYSSLKQKQFRSKESILTNEKEWLTVQIDSNKNCTMEAQSNLEEKQKEMEELTQERSSVIYCKIKRIGWNIGISATNYFSIFNIEMLPKKCIDTCYKWWNRSWFTKQYFERGSKVLLEYVFYFSLLHLH